MVALLLFIGVLILLFAGGCFVVSFFMFLKYIYLVYFKKDQQHAHFLEWFNKEYKDILN